MLGHRLHKQQMPARSVVGELSDSDCDISIEMPAPVKKPAAKWEAQSVQSFEVLMTVIAMIRCFCDLIC